MGYGCFLSVKWIHGFWCASFVSFIDFFLVYHSCKSLPLRLKRV